MWNVSENWKVNSLNVRMPKLICSTPSNYHSLYYRTSQNAMVDVEVAIPHVWAPLLVLLEGLPQTRMHQERKNHDAERSRAVPPLPAVSQNIEPNQHGSLLCCAHEKIIMDQEGQ